MHFLLISGSPVKGIAITPQKQGVWRTASNRPQLHYAPEGGICQGLLDTPHTRPVGGPVRIRLRLCRSVGQVVLTCPRPSEARRVPLRGTPARAGEHRLPHRAAQGGTRFPVTSPAGATYLCSNR